MFGPFIGSGGQPESNRARADPLGVVGVHQFGKAAPEAAGRCEDAVGGQFEIFEMHLGLRNAPQAHRGLPLTDAQPAILVAHGNKATDTLLCALSVKHAGEDQMESRYTAAGNPVLHAVEHIRIAVFIGPRGHLRGGTAGLRLGNTDGGLIASQDQSGRALFLRRRAVVHDGGKRPHVRFDRNASGHPAHFGHLFDDERHVEIAQSGPAELRRDGHAEESGLV